MTYDPNLLWFTEIRDSTALPKMFRMLIQIGNFLNANASTGNAAGFKLNSLWKILDVKASSKSITLPHFIAMVCYSNFLVNSKKHFKNLLHSYIIAIFALNKIDSNGNYQLTYGTNFQSYCIGVLPVIFTNAEGKLLFITITCKLFVRFECDQLHPSLCAASKIFAGRYLDGNRLVQKTNHLLFKKHFNSSPCVFDAIAK